LKKEKIVVRQVCIKSCDDPITIGPGVDETLLLPGIDVTLRVGITRQIKPVTRPPFTVVRGSEESLDDLCESVWGRVCFESVNFAL